MGRAGSPRSVVHRAPLPLLVRGPHPPRRVSPLRVTLCEMEDAVWRGRPRPRMRAAETQSVTPQEAPPNPRVILSEDCVSRSEAQPQSKDPLHLPVTNDSARHALYSDFRTGQYSRQTELSPAQLRTINQKEKEGGLPC